MKTQSTLKVGSFVRIMRDNRAIGGCVHTVNTSEVVRETPTLWIVRNPANPDNRKCDMRFRKSDCMKHGNAWDTLSKTWIEEIPSVEKVDTVEGVRPLTTSDRFRMDTAKIAEESERLDKRNEIVSDMFKDRTFRKVSLNNKYVETYWDRYSRNWITSVRNMDGSEVLDREHKHSDYDLIPSEYTGEILGASIMHFWMIQKHLLNQ